MRIQLLTINYEPEETGIGPYSTAIAEHLSREHDVTVITGIPHYPEWRVHPDYAGWRVRRTGTNPAVSRVRHFVPKAPGVVTRAIYELTWAVRAAVLGMRRPADLVISVVPALFGSHAARAIAARHRVPYGIFVQDIFGSSAAQSGVAGGRLIAKLTSAVESAGLRAATGVATIHPRLAGELQSVTGSADVPSVVYNWTQADVGVYPRGSQRERFGFAADDVIVLHSGNMGLKQNLEVVVDAARLATAAAPHVRFVLAGDGSQRGKLERYGADCPNLTFVDSVDGASYGPLLSCADILLVNERPGMKEMSLPSKVTSYLQAERPILAATDEHGVTGEFVRASGGGVLCAAGDPHGLLSAALALSAEPERCAALAAAGRSFARENLSAEQAFAAYDRWIAQIMSRHDARAR